MYTDKKSLDKLFQHVDLNRNHVFFTDQGYTRHWGKVESFIFHYTTLTNFSTKHLVMCEVYTDVGGILQLYHVCPPVRKIIHSLKLVVYLHVQADNPWYSYNLVHLSLILQC